jgi:hypothetical protein
MAEHSAENNLDCNGLLLILLTILVVLSSTFWTSGTTDFEMRAPLMQETVCKNSSRARARVQASQHKGSTVNADVDA